MSTIVTDTITGKSTATTITIGSTPVVSASANSMTIRGEGSNQTSIQQGLSKVNSLGYGGGSQSFAAKDSFNRSGLTDNGTGDYTVSFTNNMNNNEYTFQSSCQSEGGVSIASYNLANTVTSSFRQYSYTYHPSVAVVDTGMLTLSIFGDLA